MDNRLTLWVVTTLVVCFCVLSFLSYARADIYLAIAASLFGALGVAFFAFMKKADRLSQVASIQSAAWREQSRKMATVEEMNRTKSMFLANMSHEIRTPLSAILGFVELMDDPALPVEERLAFSKIIRNNSEYLIKVVNDILDISKIESGRLEVRKAPTEITKVVSSVTDMLKVKAMEKDLELLVEFVSDFPRQVLVDEARVRQVLVNLIGNAIKFTKEGHVAVYVACSPGTQKDYVSFEIRVSDTGEGIDPAQQDQLFNMFAQVNTTQGERPVGTGIGLALSRRLANLMGGDVSMLESVPGKGSTFVFQLPARVVREGSPAAIKGAERNPKNNHSTFMV